LIGALGALILFYFGLPSNQAWLIGAAAAAGFFMISLLPTVFESAVEVKFQFLFPFCDKKEISPKPNFLGYLSCE
jgi:hypothetical protein